MKKAIKWHCCIHCIPCQVIHWLQSYALDLHQPPADLRCLQYSETMFFCIKYEKNMIV